MFDLKLTVRESGQVYLPRFLREQGFVGRLRVLADGDMLVVLRPGAEQTEVESQIAEAMRRLRDAPT